MIPDTVLIAAEPFPKMSAQRVADALAQGLRGTDRQLSVDAIDASGDDLQTGRAVVIAAAKLDERTLAGSLAFALATRARQSGVPAYAVTAENELDLFDARMLDLQVVLQARTAQGLIKAGRRLAELV